MCDTILLGEYYELIRFNQKRINNTKADYPKEEDCWFAGLHERWQLYQ